MLEPDLEFGREDAVPHEVFEHFSKYEIRLEGRGVIAGEACTFLVLDPNVTVLAHQRVADSHPEAAVHYWAARIQLPGGSTFKTLFSWDGSFLFLLVRRSWIEFPRRYSELLIRAHEIDRGARLGPDLSAARLDFARFLEKHREVSGRRGNEMHLIREYRRLATICMERLERIPS